MEQAKEYYILFSCDEWKMKDSMNLVGVFEREPLIEVLKKKIELEEMEFGPVIDPIDEFSIREIDNLLKCGYIEIVYLNKEL